MNMYKIYFDVYVHDCLLPLTPIPIPCTVYIPAIAIKDPSVRQSQRDLTLGELKIELDTPSLHDLIKRYVYLYMFFSVRIYVCVKNENDFMIFWQME